MYKPADPPPPTGSAIREAIRFNRGISLKKYPGDEDAYRVDRAYADEYLAIRPHWEKQVRGFFDELRARNEPVVYVDVCGRADGLGERGVGANVSYSFSLKRRTFLASWHEGHEFIEGDIFRMSHFYSFLRMLERKNHRPALVTFEPHAGLQGYTPGFRGRPDAHAAVTTRRLGNNLRRLLEVLLPGGYVYIDRPFQLAGVRIFSDLPPEEEEVSLQIRAIGAEVNCSVAIERSITGPKFLLRKRKTRMRKVR